MILEYSMILQGEVICTIISTHAQISIMTCECTSITQHAILCRFWHDFYFCSLSYKYFKSIILIYRGDPITDTRTFTFCTATNILSTFCKKRVASGLKCMIARLYYLCKHDQTNLSLSSIGLSMLGYSLQTTMSVRKLIFTSHAWLFLYNMSATVSSTNYQYLSYI